MGPYKFVFQADAPDPRRIPTHDVLGVTVILLSCFYHEKVRAYHVHTMCMARARSEHAAHVAHAARARRVRAACKRGARRVRAARRAPRAGEAVRIGCACVTSASPRSTLSLRPYIIEYNREQEFIRIGYYVNTA